MKRTTEQTTLMHQLLRELPLLENLAMRAGLHITCRAIQNAVRASGWEAAGDTERANYYAPNTEGFGAVGVPEVDGADEPSAAVAIGTAAFDRIADGFIKSVQVRHTMRDEFIEALEIEAEEYRYTHGVGGTDGR